MSYFVKLLQSKYQLSSTEICRKMVLCSPRALRCVCARMPKNLIKIECLGMCSLSIYLTSRLYIQHPLDSK